MSVSIEELGRMDYADIVSCGGVISKRASECLLKRIRDRGNLSEKICGTTWLHLVGLSGAYSGDIFATIRTFGVTTESNAKDERGRSPLHMSALSASMQRTDFLLSSFLAPDERDDDGVTPLFVLARYAPMDLLLFRAQDFVERFLNMGCSPLSPDGETLRECLSPRLDGKGFEDWETLFVKSEKIALESATKEDSLSSSKRSSRTV